MGVYNNDKNEDTNKDGLGKTDEEDEKNEVLNVGFTEKNGFVTEQVEDLDGDKTENKIEGEIKDAVTDLDFNNKTDGELNKDGLLEDEKKMVGLKDFVSEYGETVEAEQTE